MPKCIWLPNLGLSFPIGGNHGAAKRTSLLQSNEQLPTNLLKAICNEHS